VRDDALCRQSETNCVGVVVAGGIGAGKYARDALGQKRAWRELFFAAPFAEGRGYFLFLYARRCVAALTKILLLGAVTHHAGWTILARLVAFLRAGVFFFTRNTPCEVLMAPCEKKTPSNQLDSLWDVKTVQNCSIREVADLSYDFRFTPKADSKAEHPRVRQGSPAIRSEVKEAANWGDLDRLLIPDRIKFEWDCGDGAVTVHYLQSPAKMFARGVPNQISDYFSAESQSNIVALQWHAANFIDLWSIIVGEEAVETHGTTSHTATYPEYTKSGRLTVQFWTQRRFSKGSLFSLGAIVD
jgi:hypothetical protein